MFYTVSLFIKDLLLWMLPCTVGFFIAYAISSFEKKAPLFIFSLFIFEALSNAMSVWYAYGCAHLASGSITHVQGAALTETFLPLWRLAFIKPAWWSADKGTFFGIFIGLIAAFLSPPLKGFIAQGKRTFEKILTRFFSRLIPLFVLGFAARIYKTHLFEQMLSEYLTIFLWLILILSLYIAFLFSLGGGLGTPPFFQRIRNLAAAAGISFSSGCSLSTMPWTIEGAAKNLKNRELAKAVIPATTNIQQIGDCIMNSFLCFLIYVQFTGHSPDFWTWGLFSAMFVLARFATAAVLGGAIFVLLPIYESYLGFTPEMIALILAFNVILDPIVTCSNVVANGALCSIFEKVWNLFESPSVRVKGRQKI